MDAKGYLEQYIEYDRLAQRCQQEHKVYASSIDDFTKHRVMLQREMGKEEYRQRMASIIQFDELIKRKAAEAIKKRDEVRSFMDSIPGIEGDVIRARHVEGLGWEDIAEKYYYSLSGIFKTYGRCLKIVQDMLDNVADQLA